MKSNLNANSLSPKSKPVHLPKTWPHVIRNGDVTVKIYKNKGNVHSENFPTFLLSCYASGKRQPRRFMDVTKASNAATLVAQQKAHGALGAAGLSAADHVSSNKPLYCWPGMKSSATRAFPDWWRSCATMPLPARACQRE